VGSGCRLKTVAGGGRRFGRLANSSWALRRSAAAPIPKMTKDTAKTTATHRKRMPGSMMLFRLQQMREGFRTRGTRWSTQKNGPIDGANQG